MIKKEKMGKRLEKVKEKIKRENKKIKEEIFFNVPNSITLLRLFLIFVFIYMLFAGFNIIWVLLIFIVAAITDWFDGYFARLLDQKTNEGARMDQIVDRVFSIAIAISLFVFLILNSKDGNNIHSIVLIILIMSREIIALPGFLIILIRNKDPYKVRYIGKVTTFLQGFAFGALILGASWTIFLVIPTCLVGIISGFDYLKYAVD